ncbi:hypothetical protein BGX28_000323 [Mortierella sp. GBA30]|nr:hypothetical protein BGX28_000323 [Mortierella sp. GBA30]
MMSFSQSPKEQQKTLKATLKAIEQDYKNKVRDAEKKCNDIRKEADKTYEREKAEIKAKKDKADKTAKDELQMVKSEASEIHIKLVMDLVKDAVLNLKARNLNLQQQQASIKSNGTLGRSSSSCSSSSTSSQSALAKEEAEIKEWIEYAAERVEIHMSKSVARQRMLEEIASGALIRQHEAQQEAMRKTEDLQRQIEHLQQLQLQHQRSLQQHQPQQQEVPVSVQGMDVPPPAYVNAVGISESDYSVYGDKKQ